ncbi:hypothetical protein [Actinokineospora inagensis]|uniref:hypothetical protein n=1 Tax=Actinokineospora inagensis TaxID=103730 RepID=UPI000406FCF2|nr:hypothetical protein [Actinokineospora inagensis]
MSEYQYFEFLAIDRPLDDDQLAEVRSLTTRASITATRFVNEYHWGDFKGDPHQLMERHYDAHLYLTNWGTHQVMFRLPRDVVDLGTIEDYCVGDQVTAWTTDESVILDFTIEECLDDFDYEPETLLPAIVGVRAELAAGDLRPLYLAWLAAYGVWERNEDAFGPEADDDIEPPIPPGLNALTTPQRALADFLHLDTALLTIAAAPSQPLNERVDAPDDLATWITHLPPTEKDRLLTRVAQGAPVHLELLRRFHQETTPPTPTPPHRTVAHLLDTTAHHRATH